MTTHSLVPDTSLVVWTYPKPLISNSINDISNVIGWLRNYVRTTRPDQLHVVFLLPETELQSAEAQIRFITHVYTTERDHNYPHEAPRKIRLRVHRATHFSGSMAGSYVDESVYYGDGGGEIIFTLITKEAYERSAKYDLYDKVLQISPSGIDATTELTEALEAWKTGYWPTRVSDILHHYAVEPDSYDIAQYRRGTP